MIGAVVKKSSDSCVGGTFERRKEEDPLSKIPTEISSEMESRGGMEGGYILIGTERLGVTGIGKGRAFAALDERAVADTAGEVVPDNDPACAMGRLMPPERDRPMLGPASVFETTDDEDMEETVPAV